MIYCDAPAALDAIAAIDDIVVRAAIDGIAALPACAALDPAIHNGALTVCRPLRLAEAHTDGRRKNEGKLWKDCYQVCHRSKKLPLGSSTFPD